MQRRRQLSRVNESGKTNTKTQQINRFCFLPYSMYIRRSKSTREIYIAILVLANENGNFDCKSSVRIPNIRLREMLDFKMSIKKIK